MKRIYNKPFVLDTNIFKNILGFDSEENTIQDSYYKDKLIKHIKNHGCKITIYTLLEVLRDEKIDNENIKNNILNFNFDVLRSEKNFNFVNIKEGFFDIKIRQELIKFSLKHLIQYASEFYSRILIVPYLYCLYAVDLEIKERNIKIDYYRINNFTNNIILEITKQLKKNLIEKTENFKKTKVQKIINNTYKWINAITLKWFNSELNQFGHTFIIEDLFNALISYKKYITFVDLSEEIIDKDHSKKVKPKHNFIKIINDSLYNCGEYKYHDTKDTWNKKSILAFIEFSQKVFKSLDTTRITDTYFTQTLYKFYIDHLYNENIYESNKKIKELIDSNDMVDLLNLYTIQTLPKQNKLLYLTTDENSKNIINQVYNKTEKEIFYDFVK